MPLNSLLSRQLRKAFKLQSDDALKEWLDLLDSVSDDAQSDNQSTSLMNVQELKRGLLALIPKVDDSYNFNQRDLSLRDRSLQLSSEELMAANEKIRQENKRQQHVIETLRHSVNKLLTEQGRPAIDKDHTNLSELSALVLELVNEQKRLENKLQSAYKQAKNANKAKSAFLATISHEIRTPMNAIIGLTHLALKSDDSDMKHTYLEKVQASSTSLLELINGILDFSKVEANKIEVSNEPFTLARVIEKLSHIFQIKAREKHLQLLFDIQCNPNIQCSGDSEKVHQVLVNLLGNAIKFTESGYVLLRITKAQNNLSFYVCDSGIGISPDSKEKLFNPFVQADATISRRYGGTGLGLTIGKRLVEMMGGELILESEVGKGSTFSFTLTLCDDSDDESQSAPLPISISENVFCITAGKEVELGVSVLHDAFKRLGVSCTMLEMECDQFPSFASQSLAFLPEDEKYWKRFLNLLRFGDFEHLNLSTIISPLSKLDVKKRMGKLFKERYNIIELPFTDSELISSISPVNESRIITNEFGLESKYWRRKRLGGKRVLVVDDDLISLEISHQILSDHDIDVTTVTNGEQALDLCKHINFDAVLLDCYLPGISGFEVAEKLTLSETWFTPIIALSADETAQGKKQALISGMCEHLVKPASPDDILHAIDMHIHSGYTELVPKQGETPHNDPLLKFYHNYKQADVMTTLLEVMATENIDDPLLDKLLEDAIEIGATNLALSLKDIMKGSSSKAMSFAERVSLMSMQLDATFRLIAHSVNHMESKRNTSSFDKDGIIAIIDNIITALEAYDAEAIHEVGELAKRLRHTQYNHCISTIRQHVGIYDFDSALEDTMQLKNDIQHGQPTPHE